jgi:hypothetical protein
MVAGMAVLVGAFPIALCNGTPPDHADVAADRQRDYGSYIILMLSVSNERGERPKRSQAAAPLPSTHFCA